MFLSFIFNFALAIVAAKDATYYYQRWDAFFNNDIGVYAFSNSYVVFALKYTKYTVAEAVLSFAISLPMLGAMIYGLLNPLINDNDHQMIHSKEQVWAPDDYPSNIPLNLPISINVCLFYRWKLKI